MTTEPVPPVCSLCRSSDPLQDLLPPMRGCGCKDPEGYTHPKCLFHFSMRFEEGRSTDVHSYKGANPAWTDCLVCGVTRRGKLCIELAKLEYAQFKDLPKTDPRYMTALSHLACGHATMHGKEASEKAIELYQELYDITQQCTNEGREDPHGVIFDMKLVTLINMAMAQAQGMADCGAALSMLQEALELASQSPKVSDRFSQLINIKAQMFRVHQLEGARNSDGSVNMQVVNAGVDMEKYKKMVELGEEVIDGLEKTEGSDSYKTMSVMKDMATLHLRMGRVNLALPLAKEAFERSQRTFGAEHISTQEFKMLYNGILRALGLAAHPTATLTGLKKRPDLNGKRVNVVRGKNDFRFQIEIIDTKQQLSARVANLILDGGTMVAIREGNDSFASHGSVERFCADEGVYYVRASDTDKVRRLKLDEVLPVM